MCFVLLNLNAFSIAENDKSVLFGINNPYVKMNQINEFDLKVVNLNKADIIESNVKIRIVSDSNILEVSKVIPIDQIDGGSCYGNFTAVAVHIGCANVHLEMDRGISFFVILFLHHW